MRGLKAQDLVAMVDFLYFGEANVNEESLDVFLGLAEELKLKGLRAHPVNTTLRGSKQKHQNKKKLLKEGISQREEPLTYQQTC